MRRWMGKGQTPVEAFLANGGMAVSVEGMEGEIDGARIDRQVAWLWMTSVLHVGSAPTPTWLGAHLMSLAMLMWDDSYSDTPRPSLDTWAGWVLLGKMQERPIIGPGWQGLQQSMR